MAYNSSGQSAGPAPGDWLPSNVGGDGARPPSGVDWLPTVFGCYGHAWRQLWPNFWRLLLIGIVGAVVFYVPDAVLGTLGQRAGVFRVIAGAYDLLVGLPLIYGAALAVLKAARGQGPEVGDLFVPFERCYGASIGAALLTWFCTAVATIFFLIPGIIVGIRLAFVPFLVVDEGYLPVAALRESWQRTRGYSWTIFGMELLAIPISVIGVVIFVVGIIPALMWIYLAVASLFVAVTALRATGGVVRQTM